MTPDALTSAFRIRALSLARNNERVAFNELISSMESNAKVMELGRRHLVRNVEFLKGFMARLNGNFREALTHFEIHEEKGGAKNFKSLREHANVLYRLDRLPDAEVYARKALRMAPGNPHVVALLADILIARALEDKQGITQEIEKFVYELVDSDRATNDSFSIPRLAKLELLRGNPAAALSALSGAKGRGVKREYLELDRADIYVRLARYQDALDQVDETMGWARNQLNGRDRLLKPIAIKVRISALCELNRAGEARAILQSERSSLSDIAVQRAESLIAFSLRRRTVTGSG